MKITRRFTKAAQDPFATVEYEQRTSRISNPDGSVVFEMNDAEIPKAWSQLATDIMVSKYFRKAGVPQTDANGQLLRDAAGNVVTGPEKSAKQVIHRLAGCWRYWGEKHNYFDTAEDAQAFEDELSYMLLHQMCAPNSPQWFNTGLNFAYGITGPAQGHYYCDPRTGEVLKSKDAYSRPQPHACFIQSVSDDLVNPGGIMDLWTREARLFKYGSGTGSNFSKLRGENEPLSGGGKSSGLMSFLKIGDRAAGAIKSGGTTRRAAKMVCLDLDHPDIESFVNWKVREELKVACLAEGIKHIAKDQQELARKLGLKLDYDFNGEAYYTVSGQNSNNSVRIPNAFFEAVEADGDWHLTGRTSTKANRTIKARDLWEQIAYAAWRCADPGVQYDDTINQWHTCPRSGRINASNPCVTGDTRVLTPGGIWRRIDTMIHLPARVVTNLHGQEIHVTEGSFPTGTREVFELTTVGGYSVKLTADHKVWTKHRGWVEAQHLTAQDEVRLPMKPAAVQEIGEPQDAKFFQLLGLYLSGANNDSTALHLDACLPGHDVAEQFAHYVNDNWSERAGGAGAAASASVYDDDYANPSMLSTSRGMSENEDETDTLTTTLTNGRLIARLQAFVRSAADNGRVRLSDEAFTSGLAAQKHFLRALFTADAHVTGGTLELRHESAELLQDVQLILLGFGIQSSLNSHQSTFGTFSQSDGEGGAIAGGGLPGRQVITSISSPGARPGIGGNGGSSVAAGRHRADAVASRHGLRIDPGSLRSFGKHVALLPGRKLEQLASACGFAIQKTTGNYDRVNRLAPLGKQQVFDLTEPVTSSFVANGITVHNCSEYMFLDDTACNLASLNVLTFFDAESRKFDIGAYKHAIRIWTIVLEVSVLMASFPSEEIARLSYTFRTLGLGYANLGAMLMQAGIPYDSEKGRAICAALTAILTGESYATSAEMARELGAFAGYEENKQEMLRVIRNHRRAAYDVGRKESDEATKRRSDGGEASPGRATPSPSSLRRSVASSLDSYEALDIHPVGIRHDEFSAADPLASKDLLAAALECWDRALLLGERHGFRNAQTTVIAPTGTIGLLMDCDTTGVEPDFALVKFKKLAGGGYFKIANQSLRPALGNLGYSSEEVHGILRYVMGTLTLHGAPVINWETLLHRGFTEAELEKIEASLPGVFEISFAFSPWTLGKEFFERMEIPEAEWQAPGFNLLRKLGFTRAQIDAANDHVCGRGCIEGAPQLKAEHVAVFDTANKCGKYGTRFIAVEGHIRMMAAAQPFISGAISKTINLPNEASVEDIKNSYRLSWELGLKANALYRDGSKLSQPLNVKSDEELDKETDADDEENVNAAREELATATLQAAAEVADLHAARAVVGDNVEPAPMHTHVIEKIVERIVERPLRRRLPDTRHATTHKFDVAGHEGYITVGLYEDGQPGEIFIRMAKEGSTIGGLMDTIATLVSVSLQYGVPVESLVRKFEHVRFEPSGMTRNADIPMAKSLVDYIFRWMAMEFVPGYRAANAPKRTKKAPTDKPVMKEVPAAPATPAYPASSVPPAPAPAKHGNGNGNGNGNGHRLEGSAAFDYGSAGQLDTGSSNPIAGDGATSTDGGVNLRLAIVADPLSQQGSHLQADAPSCDVCGSITVRSGTCYKCLNCGNSMGCS
ncbi:MAG TPA: LAGLIDADG family homing endonuclease [Tepidisphaeraceae bacterium]|nr:LAGLIDADG family homing endonuclease [Tepidisphaeraceae bacterium]